MFTEKDLRAIKRALFNEYIDMYAKLEKREQDGKRVFPHDVKYLDYLFNLCERVSAML